MVRVGIVRGRARSALGFFVTRYGWIAPLLLAAACGASEGTDVVLGSDDPSPTATTPDGTSVPPGSASGSRAGSANAGTSGGSGSATGVPTTPGTGGANGVPGPGPGPDPAPADWSSDPPGLVMLPAARLAAIRSALPKVGDPWVHRLLTSPSTIWYDKSAIVPGYQDSWGDNVVAPIGFRPNTIAPNMIDLAVPGGHATLFEKVGVFHFPFATTGGAEHPTNASVVDFWWAPRDAAGATLPVVWKMRNAGETTHRIEWIFPVGTVLGEVLLLTSPSGAIVAYEVRTRTRAIDGWKVDVFRPFPRATDLADALDARTSNDPRWQTSAAARAVAAHARDTSTLRGSRLSASHYASSFAPIDGAVDSLPAFGDETLVRDLLTKTTFRSARGVPWKSGASLTTWAATTSETFSIVPKDYDAGFLDVNETTCDRCHKDAGRPFSDYHPEVLAYGELWGEDEIFSWHPFDTANFVDGSGNVRNFNYDNRRMRRDFVDAGLVAPLDRAKHPTSVYLEIPRPWRGYAH